MQAIYGLLELIPFLPILLGIGLLFFTVQVFFITYHLIRFGIGSKPKLIALIFLSGSWLLLIVTVIMWSRVDLAPFFDFIRNGQWLYIPSI
jgi:hypothetical protein